MNSNNEKTDLISSKMEENGKETVVIEPNEEKVLKLSDSYITIQFTNYSIMILKLKQQN